MKIKIDLRRFFVPNSLRFQLLSRSLAILALLLAIIGLFQYFVMQEFIFKNQALSIQTQIKAVPPDVWQQMANSDSTDTNHEITVLPDQSNQQNNSLPDGSTIPFSDKSARWLNHGPFFFMPESTVALIDDQENFSVIFNSSGNGTTPPKLAKQDYVVALSSPPQLNFKIVNQAGGGEQLVVLQRIEMRGHQVGVIQVSMSTKSMRDMLMQQLGIFLFLAVLALLGGLLAFIPVLRKTLVPFSKMVDTVERIDAGNLDERLPVEQGQLEIDRLAVSFNGMLERLESSFAAEKEAKEQMRRFVADASHELRTPLTSIHGFLEVLLRGAMNQPERLEKSLKSMLAESERMKKLVQDLLQLAKLDRSPNFNFMEGELDSVIREMAPQLRLLAGDRKVSLKLVSNLSCRYDQDKIKQVILNLFHNAVQHTDSVKGEILISLNKAVEGVELSIKDNGSGIPEEHLPYLFDRFYRIDSSRTRKYGGSGLGLAITKSIVEFHGGRIQVESVAGQGTVFCVWLPFPITQTPFLTNKQQTSRGLT